MLTPQERAEKIRSAPHNTSVRFKRLPPEEREKRRRQAVEHDNDRGMSSTEEFIYLRCKACDA